MVVTEHYYVLVLGPIRLDPLKFVTQVGREGEGVRLRLRLRLWVRVRYNSQDDDAGG